MNIGLVLFQALFPWLTISRHCGPSVAPKGQREAWQSFEAPSPRDCRVALHPLGLRFLQ